MIPEEDIDETPSSRRTTKPTYPHDCYWYDAEKGVCMLNPTHKHDPRLLYDIRQVNAVARQDEHDCPCV